MGVAPQRAEMAAAAGFRVATSVQDFLTRARLVGQGFTGCGKRHPELGKVSGHDFSRAANASK